MKIKEFIKSYKLYRDLRDEGLVKRGTFLIDLNFSPVWVLYKIKRALGIIKEE